MSPWYCTISLAGATLPLSSRDPIPTPNWTITSFSILSETILRANNFLGYPKPEETVVLQKEMTMATKVSISHVPMRPCLLQQRDLGFRVRLRSRVFRKQSVVTCWWKVLPSEHWKLNKAAKERTKTYSSSEPTSELGFPFERDGEEGLAPVFSPDHHPLRRRVALLIRFDAFSITFCVCFPTFAPSLATLSPSPARLFPQVFAAGFSYRTQDIN